MIFKRAVANLRAQDWVAITIELVIVIVGVFAGTWVANWNQERMEKAETRKMIGRLDSTLLQLTDYFQAARKYYAVTRAYSDTALTGWRGDPRVSDAAFVIAAYQASQIYTIGINGSTWATVLGTDRLRSIDDENLRADLTLLMSSDYSQFDNAGVDTPYRRNVRRLIPIDLQDAIRAQCGDQHSPGNLTILTLPAHCSIVFPPASAANAAAILRAHPGLRDDLQWQIAALATFSDNVKPFEAAARRIRAANDRDD